MGAHLDLITKQVLAFTVFWSTPTPCLSYFHKSRTRWLPIFRASQKLSSCTQALWDSKQASSMEQSTQLSDHMHFPCLTFFLLFLKPMEKHFGCGFWFVFCIIPHIALHGSFTKILSCRLWVLQYLGRVEWSALLVIEGCLGLEGGGTASSFYQVAAVRLNCLSVFCVSHLLSRNLQ